MKKILKISGIIILSLLVLASAAYLAAYINIRQRMNKTYSFSADAISIPNDSVSIANGRHLVAIRGCVDCHGGDFSGRVMNDDAMLGKLVSANLTRGKGGLPAEYSIKDWMIALRHGVGRDGKPLIMMPSQETALFSQKDLGDIIAYIQQLPPVDHVLPAKKPGPVVYVMGYLDKFPLLPVEKINHSMALNKDRPEPGSIEQGRYLTITCQSCHRPNMKGGDPLAPGLPPVPDLTSTGAAGKMSLQEMTTALRTGRKHDGKQMDPDQMPWKMTAHFTDEEIKAIYSYLRSL